MNYPNAAHSAKVSNPYCLDDPDSLLPRPPPPLLYPTKGKPREIPVDQIERNPYQTRAAVDEGALKELSASIAATGVVQPVLVRPLADNRFQLIAGERRWLASKLAGKTDRTRHPAARVG